MLLVGAGISPWIGIVAGAALAVLVALAISFPCFRLHGPSFSLATIAFLEVFRVLALHLRDLSGGATGLMIPLKFGWAWMMFRDRWPPLAIAFGLLLLTLAVAWWMRAHRIGFYLVATRERESMRRLRCAVSIRTLSVSVPKKSRRAVRSAGLGRISTEWETSSCPSPLSGSSRSEQRAKLTWVS